MPRLTEVPASAAIPQVKRVGRMHGVPGPVTTTFARGCGETSTPGVEPDGAQLAELLALGASGVLQHPRARPHSEVLVAFSGQALHRSAPSSPYIA